MFFNIRSFLVVTFACLLAANVRAELKFTAAAAPELDAPFQTTNGWTGADGNFSVPLSSNKTVWLFSDTWVGAVENGKRARAKLINNSIALQSTGGQPEFFYRANSAGEPESFIKPESGEGYFWLFHGARNEKGLYLFLQRVKTTGQGAFGFQLIGASIGYVKNPDDHPMLWKVEQTEFPFCDFSNEEKIFFGSAILEHKNSFYIFGNRRDREKDANGMIVARVPEKDFGDFKKWRFYSKGRWVDNFRASTPVLLTLWRKYRRFTNRS